MTNWRIHRTYDCSVRRLKCFRRAACRTGRAARAQTWSFSGEEEVEHCVECRFLISCRIGTPSRFLS